LQSLEEHDQRKGAQLVRTLREYLASGCKVQPTATNLFMHPNTVMYRLKTIERITKLDLHQPDALLQAQLAIMIDDVTGPARGDSS
jgi:DNA-binding PucR family transcriptional regulator